MLLMKENEKVASITIRRGQIWEINKVYNKSLLPIGVFNNEYTLEKNKEKDADLLNEWWINNSIPIERDSIKKGLASIGINEPKELKILAHGLSLLNNYWIQEDDEHLKWEDINFWDNQFSEEIGIALFNHKPVFSKDLYSIPSPDAGINGVLKKKWIILNNEYYIQKDGTGSFRQEIYNEVFASDLFNKIGICNANYQLFFGKENNELPSCIAKCFTDKYHEQIPIIQLWDSLPVDIKRAVKNDYDKMLKIMEYYNVIDGKEKLNAMLCIDYILAGTDRHLNNISFLYNTKTGEMTFAPTYDSGTCLWCNQSYVENINIIDDVSIEAKPFGGVPASGNWEKQKQYIYNYIPLTQNEFIDSLKTFANNLQTYAKMPDEKVEQIVNACLKRAINLQEYLIKKDIYIPDINIIDKDAYIEIKEFDEKELL